MKILKTNQCRKYRQLHPWMTKDTVQGYEISSDNLQFRSKLDSVKKLLLIRVNLETAFTLKKECERRNLVLKIITWDRTNRIRIKVPYGVMPEELEVVETPKRIDLTAPYGFLEIANTNSKVSM